MTRFAPFFRLDVSHDYHGPTLRPPIAIEPDRATARLAARGDLRLRTGDGLAELFASEDRDALGLIAEAGELAFIFRLRARTPVLHGITAGLADTRGAVVVIEAAPGASGALQSGETVGAADMRPLAADGLLDPADLLRPPLALLRIVMAPEARDVQLSLRFGAVEAHWLYHVLGGAAEARIGIRDRKDEIGFDALGERVMSNGARALSFRSSAPIAARARPESRFELVSEGPFGPRVVLPALPCPAPGSGRIEKAGDARHLVSDIYVNLL